jgi:2'-5' RNA ligase
VTTSPLDGTVLGVAVALPEPYADELRTIRERLGDPDAKTVPSHVTLLPPTTVDAVLVPEIRAHLERVAAQAEPFRMRLRGAGTFRPVSPVVFVTVAEGIGGCERLERAVRSEVLARPVEYPYHPHVTVAHDLPDDVLDRAMEELAAYQADLVVDSFVLFEHAEGRWEPDRTFGFSGA